MFRACFASLNLLKFLVYCLSKIRLPNFNHLIFYVAFKSNFIQIHLSNFKYPKILNIQYRLFIC